MHEELAARYPLHAWLGSFFAVHASLTNLLLGLGAESGHRLQACIPRQLGFFEGE